MKWTNSLFSPLDQFEVTSCNKFNSINSFIIGHRKIHCSNVVFSDKNSNKMLDVEVDSIEKIKADLIKVEMDLENSLKDLESKKSSLEKSIDTDNNVSDFFSEFPWLCDEFTKRPINYDYSNLQDFEIVKIISIYLKHRANNNLSNDDALKLSEYIKTARDTFSENKISLSEVMNLYKQFDKLRADKAASIEGLDSSLMDKIGEVKLKEIYEFIQNNNISELYKQINATISPDMIRTGGYLISYGLMMRIYYIIIYKAKISSDLTPVQLKNLEMSRLKQLRIFGGFVAPVTLLGLAYLSGPHSININVNVNDNNNLSRVSQSFLGFFIFKNKLPRWLLLLLLLSFLFIFYFLGFSWIKDIISLINPFYYKIICIILPSLMLSYNLLTLIILFKYYKNRDKINIPEIYPDFIIRWLNFIAVFSESEAGFKALKDMCYKEIVVYILVLIVSIFFI
jgi:hypothetical protein